MSRFLRRAHRLRVGDEIRTEGGLSDRHYIAALEPCRSDGLQRIKVTLRDHGLRRDDAGDWVATPPLPGHLYLAPNDLIEVLYLDDPRSDPPPLPRLGAVAVVSAPLPFAGPGEAPNYFIQAGEVGVCYQIHNGDYYFIFESGEYTGFRVNTDDMEGFMLLITDEYAPDIANYRFSDYDHLEGDYRAGIFDTAFSLGRGPVTMLQFPYQISCRADP